MKKILILLVFALLFGCSKFTSEKRYADDDYVITGLLYEGQPIREIFIGKTISPGDVISEFNVTNAEVVIKEYDGEELIDSIPLSYFQIGTGVGVYVDNTQIKIISSAYRYRIEAQIGDDFLYAETDIPQSIEIQPDSAFINNENANNYPNLVYENANSEHPIVIKTINEDSINLMFEFYCMEEFENHPQYTYNFGEHDTPTNEEEYESPNDGSPRKLNYYGNYLPAMNQNDGEYYVTEQSYSGPIVFYGKYKITIYSMSDNYFNYLYKNDGYAHGGIHNGFGYFGAVSGKSIYTQVVE